MYNLPSVYIVRRNDRNAGYSNWLNGHNRLEKESFTAVPAKENSGQFEVS